MPPRILLSKGCVVYASEALDAAAAAAVTALTRTPPPGWSPDYAAARVARDGQAFHVTLATRRDVALLGGGADALESAC
eukprot:CAMPEP_0118882426 /NCGR_PEP_ID=MMETSP1163-20130328/21687_1 /TAXON_ID=124430 /ORGANISM="Phaeomonas parva, Strain CCMP2877" /LENGTH=78 /DNA_ID=CAMNT_0006819485 /DNA_START=106 /DNA_END=339 /DNA_ORIENTATION=+